MTVSYAPPGAGGTGRVFRPILGLSPRKLLVKLEGIGVSRKVVNYHVKTLDQAGLIYMEDRDRETACFAPECSASAAF